MKYRAHAKANALLVTLPSCIAHRDWLRHTCPDHRHKLNKPCCKGQTRKEQEGGHRNTLRAVETRYSNVSRHRVNRNFEISLKIWRNQIIVKETRRRRRKLLKHCASPQLPPDPPTHQPNHRGNNSPPTTPTRPVVQSGQETGTIKMMVHKWLMCGNSHLRSQFVASIA